MTANELQSPLVRAGSDLLSGITSVEAGSKLPSLGRFTEPRVLSESALKKIQQFSGWAGELANRTPLRQVKLPPWAWYLGATVLSTGFLASTPPMVDARVAALNYGNSFKAGVSEMARNAFITVTGNRVYESPEAVANFYKAQDATKQAEISSRINYVSAPSTPKPTAESSHDQPVTTRVESVSLPEHLAPQIVSGIKVYGANGGINGKDYELVFRSVNADIQQGLNQGVQKTNLQADARPVEAQRYLQENILKKDTRYLQIFVAQAVFEKFQRESEVSGVDFPTWVKYHQDIFNDALDKMDPKPNLHLQINRIFVAQEGVSDFKETIDSDAKWVVDTDYRGDVNPKTGRFERSDYLETMVIDGKTVVIDDGWTHEWLHRVTNIPDEAVQAVSRSGGIPGLFISGDGLQSKINVFPQFHRRTPWSAWAFKRATDLNLRGMTNDPRGLTNAEGDRYNLARSVEGSAWGVFGEVPDEVNFVIKDRLGQPLQGNIQIYREVAVGPNYYGPKAKNDQPDSIQGLRSGGFRMDRGLFTPLEFGNDIIFPTNWLFIISANGQTYKLQMPVEGFNVAKLAGQNQAQFELTIRVDRFEGDKDQVFESYSGQEPDRIDPSRPLLARMTISGVDATFDWFTNFR